MRRLTLAAATACLVVLCTVSGASAFKPYTHTFTGDQARADASDGSVEINGRSYTVRPAVAAAVRDWPAYYNAGVVGPDGFPDLTMGQAIIHPENTGMWLKHVYDRAWAAQSDSSYSAAQRSQILAFAYGFLTHAAGDMWAHTMVNDFALGTFPGVGEILTEIDKAEIALRHIIVEGYMGDGTPGYDGNDARGPAPGGDISNDSSPGIPFAAPIRFIYETLIDPQAPTPTAERGPLLDFFLDMQADLQVQKARFDYDKNHGDCLIIDPDCYVIQNTVNVNTIRGPRQTIVATQNCIGATIGCAPSLIDIADDLIVNTIGSAYLAAWIDDIDSGLRHWGELGLALTKAMFDPQATRDTQNAECDHLGGESNPVRVNCEDAIGAIDVVLFQADDFIDDYMLSMLGLPDAAGDVHDLLQVFGETLDTILGPALNPLRLVTTEIKEVAKEHIKDLIRDRYGIDVDQAKQFITHPTHWLNVQQASIALPVLGNVTIDLFSPADHERLDGYLGWSGAPHHVSSDFPFPGASTRLADSAVWDPNGVAMVKNTITLAKLLLLDGAELNRALGDELVAQGVVKSAASVQTYRAGGNVMFEALRANVADTPTSWLTSIDADHQWRIDGNPRFAGAPSGGNGRFPIWESCVLRPAFGGFFTDWENGTQQFPPLGDGVSADPASDTAAPQSSLAIGGPQFTGGGNTFVGPGHTLTVSAVDGVFADGKLTSERRFTPAGGTAGGFTAGSAFSLSGGDGVYAVDYRSSDPCGNVENPAGTTELVLDTTRPATTQASATPNGNGWHKADVTVTLSAVDPALGAGVKHVAYRTSGGQVAGETRTAGSSAQLTISAEGITTITYWAEDNVGNREGEHTLVVRLDKTAPVLTCSALPNALWPPNNKLVPVRLTVVVSDAGSGPAGFELVSTASDEPGAADDIVGFVTGGPDVTGSLRAQRLGGGNGRVYRFVYEGADLAGNTSRCAPTVLVAHDRGK